MNTLVFDIETVPDTISGSRLYDLDGLSEEDIARAMFAKRVQKTGGSDFLPLHLHRIVAISAVLRRGKHVKVESFGREDSSEGDLISRFYGVIDRCKPTLVSWNGGGFDLPVLHYRSLLHGVPAAHYWESDYLNRFHWRHIDLMDVLAGFTPRANAPLDEIAVMLDFPGKPGMHGSEVWDAYLAGGIRKIRHYCETDVLNTYLVYLRWELVRGNLTDESFELECALLKKWLGQSGQEHLLEFLGAWEEAEQGELPDSDSDSDSEEIV